MSLTSFAHEKQGTWPGAVSIQLHTCLFGVLPLLPAGTEGFSYLEWPLPPQPTTCRLQTVVWPRTQQLCVLNST